MKRYSLFLLNIVLIISLVSGPFVNVATAVATPKSALIPPSEQGWGALLPEQPLTALANEDLQAMAVQQAMGSMSIPDFLMEEGVMRVEPFNNIPSATLPTVGSMVPQAANPLAGLSFAPDGNGLEMFSDDETAADELPLGDLENGEGRPLWSTITPQEFIASWRDPIGSLQQKLFSSEDNVAWVPARPESQAAALLRPGGERIFLPIVISPDPEPGDEIVVQPDKTAVLISTDGLIRVEVPAGAYDEPFILRYTPAQALTGSYWLLDAVTLDGDSVKLNRSAQLYMRLPETRSGNPLIFRYRNENGKMVSLGAYIADASRQLLTFGQENDAEYLTAYVQNFGQFTYASLNDDDDPDEGDDGLIVHSYCWEPGYEGPEYVLSFANVMSTTEEADPSYAYVHFLWDVEDNEGNPDIESGAILYDAESARTDFSLEPQLVTLGFEEMDGETVGSPNPIPYSTLLTTTVTVLELETGRYDLLETDAYFTPETIACTAGCEGVPPTISGINLTQIGQGSTPGVGIGYLEIFASDNSGDFAVSVRVNGVDYPAVATNNGTYAAQIYYNIDDMNIYEITVTDSCGNAIDFPPISVWGSDTVFYGGCPCSTWQSFAADPVNTQNGNYYDSFTDLQIAGVGEANIVLNRDYNSKSALWTGGATVQYADDGSGNLSEEVVGGPPQYYGTAWTFPYAVSVNHLDLAPLYDGVEIHYPDGHSATFVNEGGVYVSTAPANFDTLTRTADGWELLHKNTLAIEYFDSDGRLIQKEDRNGNSVYLTYDGDYLMQVENDSGRSIEFSYTPDGYIETVTAPEGRTISYTYTDDLLTSVTDGNGHTTSYTYDENKQLTSVTTPKGHTLLDQVYDDKYRVDWQQNGRAEIVDFEYSEDGLTTTTTDNNGYATIYRYNGLGQVLETEDALGNTETYDYNEKFQRIYHKDKEGREWHWTYDDNGNQLTEDGPMGWHQEWTYNDLNRVTSQITYINDTLFRETTFVYDDKGNLTDIINPLDDSSHIDYDERGLPTNVFDFNGNETVNTYDPVTGDLIMTRNGAGDEVEYAYDDLGRMVDMWDGNDNHYEYTYDDADNLTDIDGPLGYHLGYEYDDNDNLRLEIDPNGGETAYWHDESELVVRIENQLDFPIIFEYDDMDNLYRMEDAEGREWFYEYDALYRQTAVHGPEDTHALYTYDKVGNLTRLTECNSPYDGTSCADNRVTTYDYNDLDQMEVMVENAVGGTGETADTNVTTEFSYDLVGNLLILTDALDNQTLYEYDLLDQLKRQEDAEEQVTEYDYDANGNLTWLQNPREKVTEFSYDGANRLATMTDADGELWQYFYDHNGNLSDEIDPLDVITRYEYDALDRVEQLIQNYVAGGDETADQNVITHFEYDLAGNLRFAYDPRGGYVTEHRYDAAHRRIMTIDNEDGETEYGYDKVNNLTSLIDGNDHETTFVYDDLNRQITITNPEDHSVTFVYDRLGNTLSITDARGYPTAFTYDGMNRVILMVDAMAGEWEYEYDAMGNVICEIDASDHANDCYTYDDVYRVLTITDAEGYGDSFSYDPNGNRLTWTDGNDHTTTYTYDNLDRLETLTNAEEETTEYRYDPLGNQTYLIEADNIVTRYDYDPLYRLSAVNQNDQPEQLESADVNVDTHYVYDEVGNLLTILDANGHETNFAYDGLNRLTREVDADFNEWLYEYDPVGNRTVRIDANGNQTNYTYYDDNQLESISYELDGTNVTYLYDENNNRTQMVDWLGTTTWTYDPLNRVTDVVDALSRHLGYGYDPVSNRTSLTYADGRTVQYSYYDNNWLQTVTDPEGNVTSYIRDGVGLMTHTDNPNSTISDATYDKANRMLTLVNQQVGGAGDVISAFEYTYNEVGHRTQMVAEYSWRNPAVVTSDYTYDGLRRLVRDEDSEGVWNEYVYDRVGNRLELHTNDDASSPRPFDEQDLYYSYSDSNRLLTIVGDTHPGWPSTKRQDNVAQAIYAFRHEIAAQAGKHITASAATNLLLLADDLITALESNPAPSVSEVTATIEVMRQQVLSDRANGYIDSDGTAHSLLVKLVHGDAANNGTSGDLQTQTFRYDANGNRINKEFPGPQGPQIQGMDYAYDPENRLIEALDYQMNEQGNRVDRGITTLDYDGNGRRLVKTYDPNEGGGGAKRVEYVFDGLDPVAEYNIWNPQYENFYRGDLNRIITMHHFPSGTQGQMYWYHYDGLGSTSGLTKQRGQSHHNYRYEAYGEIEHAPGNHVDPHNHYTFTGQEWDENMGLYEFFARDYDPFIGVWLTQDTYRGVQQSPGSFHRYQYVYGNPISYYDPTGHWPEWVDKATNWVEDKIDKSVDWAVEHKNEIAIGSAVVAATVVTVATAGAASPLLVAAGAAAAGAGAAATATLNVNSLNMAVNHEGSLTDDLLRNTVGGGMIGFGIGFGGGSLAQAAQVLASPSAAAAPWLLKAQYASMVGGNVLSIGGLSIGLNPSHFFDNKRWLGTYLVGAGMSSYTMSNIFGFLYSIQSQCTSLNWNRVVKNGENRYDHVNLHGSNNLQKPTHGIFYGDPVDTTNNAWATKGSIAPITQGGVDKYIIPYSNAGYQGGYTGQGQNLDYVTIITEKGTNNIITSYPSYGN